MKNEKRITNQDRLNRYIDENLEVVKTSKNIISVNPVTEIIKSRKNLTLMIGLLINSVILIINAFLVGLFDIRLPVIFLIIIILHYSLIIAFISIDELNEKSYTRLIAGPLALLIMLPFTLKRRIIFRQECVYVVIEYLGDGMFVKRTPEMEYYMKQVINDVVALEYSVCSLKEFNTVMALIVLKDEFVLAGGLSKGFDMEGWLKEEANV